MEDVTKLQRRRLVKCKLNTHSNCQFNEMIVTQHNTATAQHDCTTSIMSAVSATHHSIKHKTYLLTYYRFASDSVLVALPYYVSKTTNDMKKHRQILCEYFHPVFTLLGKYHMYTSAAGQCNNNNNNASN